MIVDLSTLNPHLRQQYLQHAIAPRPICFASTIDPAGNVNLSPFSFFNLFSTTPPIVIFSPSRRLRDNTTKHSLQNLEQVPEVVINLVDYDMIQQTSLSSCEYPKGINEFVKAGFTADPATLIRPPMVKESKIKLECTVKQIIALGNQGGAGNLVICEVLRMHVDESVLGSDQMIDQRKMHHVARLGGDWYCRVDEACLLKVEKPNSSLGIGFDALPSSIRESRILSGNHLGQLANLPALPDIDPSFEDPELRMIIQYYGVSPQEMEVEIHRHAARLLDAGKVREAWQVLLSC